jgi:hypothetical protein
VKGCWEVGRLVDWELVDWEGIVCEKGLSVKNGGVTCGLQR